MSDEPKPKLQSPSAAGLGLRLGAMMFLQYFIQGCYLPIVSVYLQDALGFSKTQIGVFGSALAVGPLFASFVVGQLVDRRFATQHVLAACHALGGGVMIALYFQQGYLPIVVLGAIYSVLYVPTMMLTNSLSFHHLPDRERQFPIIRVWGTIGFVAPAWIIERVLLRGLADEALNTGRGVALLVAGLAGLVMAVYSLTLPATPPQPRASGRSVAPMEAAGLLRARNIAVLVVVSFLIAIVHKFFFVVNAPFLRAILDANNITGAWEGSISSIGQIAEIGVMAGLGWLISRAGFKFTLLLGATAYMLRCLVFSGVSAVTDQLSFGVEMTIVCCGQALHGVCFACFLAAAFMYMDKRSPADLRGSVQNLYGTFVLAAGYFVGGFISGAVAERLQDNWPAIWASSGALAAVCVLILLVAFPKDDDGAQPATA
ncbi:MAG: MFS transporter [Pirellulaceae bacterium]|nr:MFS transporter [Pirellulaceae bacterium]MDP7014230.1 MFS transporter [Pirellulaceae bacterium]